VLGAVRYAPPFAARSWTEIVGDFQYVRALFTFGYGPVALSDLRLGETPLDEFDDVEMEVREGRPGDPPISFYPYQVVEESVGAELIRPLLRDAEGEEIRPLDSELKPIVQTTGEEAAGASIILVFPAGLILIDKKGKRRQRRVTLRVEQRLATEEDWQEVREIEFVGRKLEPFFRQFTWAFPSRGRWQVRLTMLTEEHSENAKSNVSQRMIWAALQTLRPEYPLNFQHPLTLVALRIRATHQISGTIDNFSAMAATLCLDWDHDTGSWVERQTSNPASLFRHVLQSPANIHPVADSEIDLEALQDWHDFCRLKGLHYDAAHDQASSALRDVLSEVAAAGRAAPRHDGLRWSVTIDRPENMPVVDHVNPRNSREFRATRRYFKPPHAVRVQFLDATSEFQPAERIVRWPGYTGPIDVTEALPLPGKVWPDEVWREARRRMYEVIHRPDAYQCAQDGAARVATRGDAVVLSHFVLANVEGAARVRSVENGLIVLDDDVPFDATRPLAIRFRRFASPEDGVGTSVLRSVTPFAGQSGVLELTGLGPDPMPGDLVHIGPSAQIDRRVIVRGIEAGEDMSAVLHLIDAAPVIDALVDAETPPPWSGQNGPLLDVDDLVPPVPKFTSVTSSEFLGLLVAITFEIEPGFGFVITSEFEVQHRLLDQSEWTSRVIPAAAGGGLILAYQTGDTIVLRARALTLAGVPGDWTSEITVTVGRGLATIPSALDPDAISVTPLFGAALVMFATGGDLATSQVQIYRSTAPVLDRDTDAVGEPVQVTPQTSYSMTMGDTTRSNLLVNGDFSTGAAWSMDDSWEIAAGRADHEPGAAGAIGQPLATTSSRHYRIGFDLSDSTGGTLTPRLTGGTIRSGASVGAAGYHLDRLEANAGNNRIEWLASSEFDGALDDAVAYLETAACLEQGTHYIWLEPQNEDDIPGPIAGPFQITVI
ncbi:MAG: phage tail protein, partial [Pararhodobacter sp.]|nr:phage tail protein [Pararhodobacter sp.]